MGAHKPQRSLTYERKNMENIPFFVDPETVVPLDKETVAAINESTELPADEPVGGSSFYDRLVAEAADRVQESLRQTALNPRPAPTEETPPVRLVLPRSDPADIVDNIDPDLLAHAMALGLWTRFEWALEQIGALQEIVAGLKEGIRVRDEQIDRLKKLNEKPTVHQITRQLFP